MMNFDISQVALTIWVGECLLYALIGALSHDKGILEHETERNWRKENWSGKYCYFDLVRNSNTIFSLCHCRNRHTRIYGLEIFFNNTFRFMSRSFKRRAYTRTRQVYLTKYKIIVELYTLNVRWSIHLRKTWQITEIERKKENF